MSSIVFAASVFNSVGGGSKTCALRAKTLRHFSPMFFSWAKMADNFFTTYGLQKCPAFSSSWSHENGIDVSNLPEQIRNASAIITMTGLASNVLEYEGIWKVARAQNIPIRILDCVFAIGNISHVPDAQFILAQSFDCLRNEPQQLDPRIFALYSPVNVKDTGIIGRNKFRERFGISQNCILIGSPCADRYYTDRLLLSSMVKLCENSSICFVTIGANYNNHPTHQSFYYCGILSQEEMMEFYAACDIIVHVRSESFGYNVIDALALGKPVVFLWTAALNAPAEFLWPNSGYIARDGDGFINAINHIIAQPEGAAWRADNAKKLIEKECSLSMAGGLFESLLLRAAIQSNIMSSSVLNEYEWTEIYFRTHNEKRVQWMKNRLTIENLLKEKSFI
jgi:glycosyltransferase involved in cell wall biosynthesis